MSNHKKPNLPAMPFYIGDWKKDPAVEAMTPEDEGIYLRLCMLCWESEKRGYLQINNKPIPIELLTRMVHLDNQRLTTWLTLYQDNFCIFGLTADKIMYSKKQVDILELSEKRKIAGKKGGNPVLKRKKEIRLTKGKPIGKPNTKDESENEDVIKDESVIESGNENKTKSETNEIFDYFCKNYEMFLGNKYIATFAKDKKIIKDLLNIIPKNELMKIIVKYFESDDDFIIKSGYTMGVLKSTINKIRNKPKNEYSKVTAYNIAQAKKFLERGKNEAQ